MSLAPHFFASLRALRRRPGPLVAAVLSLGLGLGATAAVLGVLRAVVVDPLPFRQLDQLALALDRCGATGRLTVLSQPNFRDWQTSTQSVEGFEGVSGERTFVLGTGTRPLRVLGELVTDGFFDLLGVRAARGRLFQGTDDELRSVLISHALWQGPLGGRSDIVGSTLLLNSEPYEVLGVVEPPYRGILWETVDVWLPVRAARAVIGERYELDRGLTWLFGVVRLPAAESADATLSELRGISQELLAAHSTNNPECAPTLEPLHDFYFGSDLIDSLRYLGLGAIFLLAICAFNVLGLTLAQAGARHQEHVLRRVVGASRRHLFQLHASWTTIAAVLGCAVALVLAGTQTRSIVSVSDLRPAAFVEEYLTPPILAITLACALVLALGLALLPTLLFARLERRRGLHSTNRSDAQAPQIERLRALLTLFQIAASIVLLSGAGIATRSVLAGGLGDPGFPIDDVETFELTLRGGRYDEPQNRAAYVRSLESRVGSLPGVESVAITGPRLVPEVTYSGGARPEGAQSVAPDEPPLRIYRHYATPGLADALGLRLLDGRFIEDQDREGTVRVAVLGERVANLLWPDESPISRRFKMTPASEGDPWIRVVGVVADARHRGLQGDPGNDRDVYLAFAQDPQQDLFAVVRAPGASLEAIRQELVSLDTNVPVEPPASLRSRLVFSVADTRFLALLLGVFSAVATLVAAIGLYGVLSSGLQRQRRDLAVRMAVGATPGDLARWTLRRAVRIVAPGLLLGLGGSWLFARALGATLYGVEGANLGALGLACCALLATTLIAVVGPVVRARRTEVTTLLRSE